MMTPPTPKVVTDNHGESFPLQLMKTVITEVHFLQLVLAHYVKVYRSLSVECVLEFPLGTLIVKEDASTFHERYMITLPDNFRLRATWNNDLFLLFVIVDDEDNKEELPVV